ncbi:MAG: hypothetical protein ABIO43_09470 [Sphingomicrobium sp.]
MLTGLLMTLAAATVHQSSPTRPDTIVVTGEARLTEASARRAIEAVSLGEFQLARFHGSVCPMALGVAPESARSMEERIRRIASAAGVKVAPSPCVANFVVILASDVQSSFADIKAKHPDWLVGVTPAGLSRLERERGPVLAWSSTTIRNENGETLSTVDRLNPQNLRVQSASILSQPTRQQIDGSVVIINSEAALGKTVGQLANYAAMRGLAQTRIPNEVPAVNTILSLFHAASPPKALTSFDFGYLRALYASNGRETAARERSRMARLIASSTHASR